MSYAQYCRLGVHVLDSRFQVIRAARAKILPFFRHDSDLREPRHAFYRAMLSQHAKARRLYVKVQQGDLS